tara:strand:- start:1285 stop:1491 length:207 start_codon:yes stop_codon:yes gene_type:complete
MKKVIDGKVFDMTAEEIAERNADVEKAKKEREQEKINADNKENKKISGKQKLKDLGLDDDEINALMGV